MLIGMELNSDAFLRAVREGIAGYMLKDATAAEIAAAVRAPLTIKQYAPRSCARFFLTMLRGNGRTFQFS